MKTENINTYAINLKCRTDRYQHITEEFNGRDEFNLTIVEACEHTVGAIGLWQTLNHIILTLVPSDVEYILICEDDHQFTERYHKELLFNAIREAQLKEADVLIGGLSWYETTLQISRDLFWVETFSGLQFTIIYRKFFQAILNADFTETDAADYKISALSKDKLVLHPFISVQKEFGYSDVTQKNNVDGRVSKMFSDSSEILGQLKRVSEFYNLKPLIS